MRVVGVPQLLLLLLRQAGAQHSDGGVCASLPCQHQGSCTEILRPAPDAGSGGDGDGNGGGHRILQSKDCSLKAVGAKTALINDECCGADDEACSEKGVPSSCDAGCAAVFLPFWHSCGSLFDSATYEPVVALCDAVPTPTPCDMAAVAAQTGERGACKRDVLAEMRFHDGAVPRAADVDRECCGAGDADCAEGVPASCDTGCAAAFLPFWSSCGSMFDAATCKCSRSLCVASSLLPQKRLRRRTGCGHVPDTVADHGGGVHVLLRGKLARRALRDAARPLRRHVVRRIRHLLRWRVHLPAWRVGSALRR